MMEELKLNDLTCCEGSCDIKLSVRKDELNKFIRFLTNNYEVTPQIGSLVVLDVFQKISPDGTAEFCKCLYCNTLIENEEGVCKYCGEVTA